MWKWLHPYAKHETQYHLCGKLSPFFGAIAVLLLAVGIVWGLAYAPADYQQGNSFRIMYVHVPAAIWSMGVYGSLALAKEHDVHSIAFPAISTGVYGYPLDAATQIAVDTVTDWLQSHVDYDMRVIFCCFDARTEQAYQTKME